MDGAIKYSLDRASITTQSILEKNEINLHSF